MSAVFLGGNAAFRVRCGVLGRDAIFGVRCGVLGRDAARHVATKAVRGLCIDGHRLERNDIPDNADCRGGVFAVFAKISPPVLAAFRGYGVDAVFWGATRHATSLQRPCGVCIDGRHLGRNDIPANADCRGGVFAVFAKIPPPVLPRVLHGYKPWAYSPSSGQPARYLRGVEAGILSLPSEFCKSPLGAIFYGGALIFTPYGW